MKHLLKLTLLLLVFLLPANAIAHDFVVNGIYYLKNGTEATVTFRGSSYDQYSNEYTGDVIIPASVTYNGTTYSVSSIGESAFESCSSLMSVTIPNSVTSIGVWAFYECSGLTSVTIPNSVTDIGPSAFSACTALETLNFNAESCADFYILDMMDDLGLVFPKNISTINIGDGVKRVPAHFADGLNRLTSISIPNSVAEIGPLAFYECSGLTSVTIGNSVTTISLGAFNFCTSLTSIDIPNSVTSIGEGAFINCSSLTSVTIGNSVTSIDHWAFSGCSGLTSIAIPNSVTSIGYGAFSGCSNMSSLIIGNSVTSFGGATFDGCSALTSIIVDNGNTTFDSRDNCNAIIETATNTLITGCMNSTIPNSVTSIGDNAFYECRGLTSITIPNSVTSIGSNTFYRCSGLTSIIVESGNTTYDSRDNCNAIIETATNTLITGCMRTIIPNSVTAIGNSAFSGCSGLTSITIPSDITFIGHSAFWDCSSLNDVYCYIMNPTQISMGSSVFYRYPQNYSSRRLYVATGSSGVYRSDKRWSDYFGSIVEMETLVSPNIVFADADVKAICVAHWDTNGDGELSEVEAAVVTNLGLVFQGSDITSFDELNYFTGLTSISDQAFYGCSGLKSVIIPNSIISIGEEAFCGCSGLTSITIPSDVARIGSQAFVHCSSLTSIDIYGSPNIEWFAFYDCNSLSRVNISSLDAWCGVNCIYDSNPLLYAEHLYLNGIEIIDLVIPESVTKIGDYAFAGSNHIKSVTIPNTVKKIGESAFFLCDSLERVYISDLRAWCNILFKFTVGPYEDMMDSYNDSSNPLAYAHRLYLNGQEIKHLNISESITTISSFAFTRCNNLESVTIPNSVVSIGDFAFYCCGELTSVTIPSSVTSIGTGAFYFTLLDTLYYNAISCDDFESSYRRASIKTIIMGQNVKRIPAYFADGCIVLTSLTIPSSVASIGDRAFEGCSGLEEVYSFITDPSLISMGSSVFYLSSHNYGQRTLYVPFGSLAAYQADNRWSQYFGFIVEMEPMVATSIELNKSAAMMEPGDELQLTAELQPIEAIYNEVLWGSNNPSVVTVTNDGLVTAVNVGIATITATTTDGSNLTASCLVTVYTQMNGDVDGNGSVNISDVTALIDYLLNGDTSAIVLINADCDGNGVVNISDVTELIDYLLSGYWPEPEPVITSYTVNGVTFKMVSIEGGTFTMGATEEQGSDALDRENPAHQVTLSSYCIGETEVTQELWVAVMGSNPSNFSSRNGYPENLSLPVEYVSWNSCQSFISKLNEMTGEHFRLPTEAEWEFAARGGIRSMGFKYAGSNDIDAVAWYNGNSNSITHTVGSKVPNELGLYDMSGNVWEWCQDWYDDYPSSAQTDPMGPATGSICVYRGGGWSNNASYSRVSSRSGRNPTNVFTNVGLRLALD